MPLSLRIMAMLGLLFGLMGLPVLLRPAATRTLLGLKNTPQMVYILRIVGTMLAALGLVLIVFALTFWKTA
ncbi:hypothetical protein ACSBM8_13420 [Sphingomonas sp. ASY06-1R]|uniref:hypothetical protein n=1 Tax=Sphingomonas sp. ASY06-1R TaxID=3445771 RepID=UPI003FA2765D